MVKTFTLHFENGLPKGTAQQKGEGIAYKTDENGRRVPYIKHFKKDKISAMRTEFVYRLNRYAPRVPRDKPVRLFVWVCFDIKTRTLWGKYKTTRPDCDNYVKELKDAMTEAGFWHDDAQVVDLRVVKTYAEKASISIQVEDLGAINKVKGGTAND